MELEAMDLLALRLGETAGDFPLVVGNEAIVVYAHAASTVQYGMQLYCGTYVHLCRAALQFRFSKPL